MFIGIFISAFVDVYILCFAAFFTHDFFLVFYLDECGRSVRRLFFMWVAVSLFFHVVFVPSYKAGGDFQTEILTNADC